MRSERPKIKIPFQPIDVAIEAASIGFLLFMWLHLFLEFSSLPDSVPSHFNAKGEPDNYSHKSFLFFLPALSTVIYLSLFILNKYPHLHNYMVNITTKNAFKNYQFSSRVLRIVNFLCVLMFTYINYQIIVGAKENTSSLGMGFIITVLIASLLLPIILLIYQKKLNNQ